MGKVMKHYLRKDRGENLLDFKKYETNERE